jgi:hypothetical protein
MMGDTSADVFSDTDFGDVFNLNVRKLQHVLHLKIQQSLASRGFQVSVVSSSPVLPSVVFRSI